MDEFAVSFQKDYDHIVEAIQSLQVSQVSETQAAINRLSDGVRDNVSIIPAHDRKIYDGRIKDLQQKLRDRQTVIVPKKRFAFASKNTLPARKSEPEPTVQISQTTSIGSSSEVAPVVAGTRPAAYEDIHGARIDIDSNGEDRPCRLWNLSFCIVDLRAQASKTTSFASLTAKEIDQCIIVCDHINGPVHLTGIRNSIVVVSAKQFRMHKSQNCDIYLQMTSRPIIEDCSNIRFTALPDFLRLPSDDQKSIEVDDFNWHRSEPSPNWSILADTEAIKSERWQAILEDKNVTVQDVLKDVQSYSVANAMA